MKRLLLEYDMENTILLEVEKMRAVAMGMRFCNWDLETELIRSIGQVILDSLGNIKNYVENDCKEVNNG